jgi:ribonuclease HII
MDESQMGLPLGPPKHQGFRRFEAGAQRRGFKCVAGLDEAGRGPLAGPVVAAAVVLPPNFAAGEINDSKLLSPAQRERLAPLIRQRALALGIGVVDVEEIDRINILQASLLAMVKALRELALAPDYVLIDGNQSIPPTLMAADRGAASLSLYQQTVIKGDRLCLSIAAASIIAKVARDQMMIEFDKQYPEYGFAGHKGYGSAAHLDALRRHGPSPIHRLSYKPVREAAAR